MGTRKFEKGNTAAVTAYIRRAEMKQHKFSHWWWISDCEIAEDAGPDTPQYRVLIVVGILFPDRH